MFLLSFLEGQPTEVLTMRDEYDFSNGKRGPVIPRYPNFEREFNYVAKTCK